MCINMWTQCRSLAQRQVPAGLPRPQLGVRMPCTEAPRGCCQPECGRAWEPAAALQASVSVSLLPFLPTRPRPCWSTALPSPRSTQSPHLSPSSLP